MILKAARFLCLLMLARAAWAGPGAATMAPPTADEMTSYAARGVVEKIAPDMRHATIHHQAIPGYMMEMTMDFQVRDTNELTGIVPGDIITFTLEAGGRDEWIEHIQRVGRSTESGSAAGPGTSAAQPASGMVAELKPGDRMPNGDMMAEDGRHIRFSDFRGRALAFTFFFTRCPLPDYCPLMNRNFAAARDVILTTPGAPDNWQFLSVSFDSEFDTPETLENYANAYRGQDTGHWLFAAMSTNALAELAPRLDLMVVRQGTSISHNLRTVVLDPQGRIFRQFDGNQWTARELADAVIAAAGEK